MADDDGLVDHRRKVTDEKRELVVTLYDKDGLTMREVAAKVNLSYGTVNRIITAADVNKRPTGGVRPDCVTDEERATAVDLYVNKRIVIADIATAMNRSYNTIVNALDEEGIVRRRGRPRREDCI